MIGYLKGTVSHLFADSCFIDVQGVGYRVFVPGTTRQKLSVGAGTLLFTYLNVREDALLLYGFATQDEYDLFLLLTSVSGVGPKVAMGILSAMQPADFRRAVLLKDHALLTKLPGVGKKTAERLVLELKDKIGPAGQDASFDTGAAGLPAAGAFGEALEALVALGYNQSEAAPALRKIDSANLSAPEMVRLALKEFIRR